MADDSINSHLRLFGIHVELRATKEDLVIYHRQGVKIPEPTENAQPRRPRQRPRLTQSGRPVVTSIEQSGCEKKGKNIHAAQLLRLAHHNQERSQYHSSNTGNSGS